jgi:hypothetical protein
MVSPLIADPGINESKLIPLRLPEITFRACTWPSTAPSSPSEPPMIVPVPKIMATP